MSFADRSLRPVFRVLVLAAAWLLHACGSGPTDPFPPPPGPSPGWNWTILDFPADVPAEGIYVHPTIPGVLFGSALQRGVWASHDDGLTWEPIAGFGVNNEAIQADPARPERIWVGVWDTLKVSLDTGRTLTSVHVFPRAIRSIHVSPLDGAIYVAPQWETEDRVPGIFRSRDDGETFEFRPYGVDEGLRILTWDIEEEPLSRTLFLANEIADHPQPYRPPLLRSTDRGDTWTDATGPLWWHSQKMAVDGEGAVYVLLEGPGLWRSTDLGTTWKQVGQVGKRGLLVDPLRPDQVYVGDLVGTIRIGGLYFSIERGEDLRPVTLAGMEVEDIDLDPAGRRLYVVADGRIRVAERPEEHR